MAKARLERSMTEGSPTKLILSFALPIVIGNLFQQFYTMVDTIIVGRYVGTEALAAVGSTGMITFLILGFFMGMTAGFSVPISQCYGAQDDVGVRKAVGSAALLSVFFTALITALSVGGTNWLLTLLNTPEEIFRLILTSFFFAAVLPRKCYTICSPAFFERLATAKYRSIF